MQREKLYNPQSKAYFNCILFVFKNSKILCDQFSLLRKNPFFSTRTRNCFFLISSFYHLICFRKKNKIYYKMQDEKLYNLPSKAYCNCSQKKQNSMRTIFAKVKIDRTEFCFF